MPPESLTVLPLTLSGFRAFGEYVRGNGPTRENAVVFGQAPIRFFPDQLLLDTDGKNLALSVLEVSPRPFVVDTTEYHTTCGELIMPLTGDVLIHVGPPTPDGKPPLDRIEIFEVPALTAVYLKRGVWHHAPFALSGQVMVLIGLPPRIYANDCTVVDIHDAEQLPIAIGK